MKTNAHRFGMAGAATIGIYYTLLALLMKFVPEQTVNFIAKIHMTTLDTQTVSQHFNITLPNFIIGLTAHLIFAYLFFWLLATIHNKLES